ncbi:phosphoenolpyruvate carboxykinase (ATP) [Georgenia subflava]|uniref:HPr kinase/phosphorylase C-terminal domain-containing protein n=1 Tax=Georgenia subflava TaxID=1622177 RepID=A0A6N7ESG3_9MICO|nr:hypothetical protein [Georgenia subflava]MPV38114.1 hypothetical protein [Georgenia subflava]
MTRISLYGLTVDSDIDLHQDRPAAGPPDITVRRGARIARTDERPDGRVLLHLDIPERQLFTATQVDDGYVLRFYGTCDFLIDPTLTEVEVRAVDGADADLLGVLVSGTLLSFVLAMRGHPVLHASAVQVGGVAVAFVGASGMGKSTMATLLCAEGGRLITDDVLRLDLGDGPPRCRLGATALRLRKAAGDLSALFDDTPARRVTGDGRDALAMVPATDDLVPLGAIVIPVPQHEADLAGPELVRLGPKEAIFTLLRFPRIVGWEDPSVLDQQFQELGAIVDSVPVYAARLPWGPPFSATLARDVLAGLSLVHASNA